MVAIPIIVLVMWISRLMLTKASNEVFNQCIRSTPHPGIMRCIGQQTISSLQTMDKMDNFTLVNGLEIIRPANGGQQRALNDFFVEDPTDFRGLLENAGTLVGQRTLQWDLSMLQPGLCLRVGPTSDSNSVLEFLLDPRVDRGDRYLTEEPSTARVLTRQFVVPFLLGLKFNLVTILPLLFAGILLCLKKAMFLGKFALFISGLLGFGGLLTFGQFGGVNSQPIRPHRPFGGGLGGGGLGGGGLGGGGLGQFGGAFANDPISNGYYKSVEENLAANFATTEKDPLFADTFYDFEKKLLQSKSDKMFVKEPEMPTTPITIQTSRSPKSYRTFVWEAS